MRRPLPPPPALSVVLWQFDDTEDAHQPWLICPRGGWCQTFQDRVSASIINAGSPHDRVHYAGAPSRPYIHAFSPAPPSPLCPQTFPLVCGCDHTSPLLMCDLLPVVSIVTYSLLVAPTATILLFWHAARISLISCALVRPARTYCFALRYLTAHPLITPIEHITLPFPVALTRLSLYTWQAKGGSLSSRKIAGDSSSLPDTTGSVWCTAYVTPQ